MSAAPKIATPLSPTDIRLTLLRHGYKPVPAREKKPDFSKGWNKICAEANGKDIINWRYKYPRHTDTGILGGSVVAIDIDVLDEKIADEIEALSETIFGTSPLKRTGKAPKKLLVYRTETPFDKIESREFILAGQKHQVEILADGQQFIAFGIHPGTGKNYEWSGSSPLDMPLQDLPVITEAQCAELVVKVEALLRQAGAVPDKPTTPKAAKKAKPKTSKHLPFNAVNSAALQRLSEWVPMFFPEAKFQRGTGAYRLPPREGQEEGISIHPDGIRDFGDEVGLTPIGLLVKLGKATDAADAMTKLAEALKLEIEFEVDGRGKIVGNSQGNIRTAIAKLGIKVSLDKFQDRPIIEGLDGLGPHLDDRALNRLYLRIDEEFRLKPSFDFFYRVVSDVASRNAFHPVQNYLNGLKWDGVPRVDGWLKTYAGAKESKFVKAVGAIFLIAAVRRVRQPGCKFDELLVLESKQGTNKSSALKILAVREDWFSDDIPLNADGKRVIEALQGKWLLEAAELKGMKSSEVEHLKAFLSRSTDIARMSYDRMKTEVPRQCVLAGTTNSEQYLMDNTGNRRYWPIKVREFDLDLLRADRDQLWAEAAHREAEGASIRLDPELYVAAAEAQGERHIDEPFLEILEEKLIGLNGKISSADVWRLIGREPGKCTQHDNVKRGEALRKIGFEFVKARFDKKSARGYARGTRAEREKQLIHVEFDEFNQPKAVLTAVVGVDDVEM